MSISPSAVRRRSFRLHKAILGISLALASVAGQVPQAQAASVNVDAASDMTDNDEVDNVAVGNNETITFNTADGVLTLAGKNITAGRNVIVTKNGVLKFAATGASTIASVIKDGGTAGTLTINTDDGLAGAATGTLTLSGTNTYTGTTELTAGAADSTVVVVTNAAAFGADTAGTTLNASTEIQINGAGDLTISEPLTLAGGTVNSVNNNNTLSGTVAVTADSTIDVANGDTLTISGVISGDDAIEFGGTAGRTGTVILTGVNTYTGTMTITRGTLRTQTTGTLTDAIVVNNAALDINNSITIKRLSGTGTVDIAAGTSLAFGDATNTTISGVISGTGSLVKQGTSVVTLSGVNTYTGPTTINAGSLKFGANGVLPAGNSVTINNGGTLDLGGFASNALTINTTAGSTLKNGVLSGTLNAQGLTVENITGNADINFNSGSSTIRGTNALGDVAFNAGTVTIGVPTAGNVPLTSSGTISANGGQINVDATGLTNAQIKGDKTIIAGTVPDAVGELTTFTYAAIPRSLQVSTSLCHPCLYDVSLLKDLRIVR